MNQNKPVSILLVEDEKDACEIISSMLVMKFPLAQIYSAEDGKIGLDTFGINLPDIVITDINMPEMDGFRMLEIIHDIKPDACVIVITAHSGTQYLRKIADSGVVACVIAKPIDFELLFAAIQNCIESQSKVN